MRVKRDGRCPVMVEVDGRAVKSPIVGCGSASPGVHACSTGGLGALPGSV
jgi:hypothetical protein